MTREDTKEVVRYTHVGDSYDLKISFVKGEQRNAKRTYKSNENMKEDFVSFSLAKKLKEKGYQQKTGGRFSMIGPCYFDDGRFYEDGLIGEVDYCFTAPTIAQAMKWLREEKKIHIAVDVMKDNIINWGYDIVLIDKYKVYHFDWNSDSYESAALAGIEYVLDNLA